MIRFVLRLAGLVMLAGAFAALIIDGTRSIAADALRITTFEGMVRSLAPVPAASLRTVVDTLEPPFAHRLAAGLLDLPDWAVLVVLGLVLFAVTQRRRPKIGYPGRRGA